MNKGDIADQIEDWLFEEAYNVLTPELINQILQLINQWRDNEDSDS